MGRFISYVVVFLFGMYTGIFAIYNSEYLSQGAAKMFGASITRPLYVHSSDPHRFKRKENPRPEVYRSLTNLSDDKKFGIYTIQVASFPSIEQARELVAELNYQNVDAYVAPDDLSNQRGWYRVYVGKYFEKLDARKEWRDIRKDFRDSFVRKF